MIGLEHYLIVAAALFVIGIFGLFLNHKNVIILLMRDPKESLVMRDVKPEQGL